MGAASISLTSGMRQNLYSLQVNSQNTEITSRRLSSGFKVETALDDPINFFMARNHRQRASDFMARKDEMGEAIQTVKAASVGIESAITLLMSAKSTAQAALSTSDTDEREELADQFNDFSTQLDLLVEDSGYKGVNLLKDGSELEVNFNENGTSSIAIDGFDASSSGLEINEVGGVVVLVRAT
ncbi:MAG: hypothetical protein U9Q58_07510 [Pseudomonadota bacterium]|nr:hypothetical protein [Pseudomonadota bacterium]